RLDIHKMHDGRMSPMETLSSIYKNGPPGLASAIDHAAMEVMMVELPKISIVAENGIEMSRGKEFESVENLFKAGMVYARARRKRGQVLTATVRDAAEQLAVLIDKSVKRVLLEDTVLNRHAYLDIISTHAKMVRALQGLTEDVTARADAKLD
ncbi:hypothetical protein LCGC14_2236390, partial [marine sediment metagenome]